MSKLHLAGDLALPREAVTHTFAVLGMRGSGKSNAAVVLAEEMHRAGLHWVAIDPKGDWWGLRSSADGKAPGLPIVVFGGRHGDLPIEPTSGAYLAELVVRERLTAVVDVSEFTEGEKVRFLAGAGREDGFAMRLYRSKNETQPPTHIFFEEADDVFPQKAFRDKAKLLHDCSRLLLWGRARGIGTTLCSQRSARVNKDALTQTDTLIALRTTAPQDKAAIRDWVEHHGQERELVNSLPSLKNGEGWVWSPEWLGLMQRVRFRRRSTYDSGATPAAGAKATVRPATVADVDLAAIRAQMQETIERAKADDPRELRRRIAELERAAAKPAGLDAAAAEAAREAGYRSAVQEFRKELDVAVSTLLLAEGELQGATEQLAGLRVRLSVQTGVSDRERAVDYNQPRGIRTQPDPPAERRLGTEGRKRDKAVPSAQEPTTMERRMLTALAQHPEGLTKAQVRLHADYADSGPVSRAFARLSAQGWVEPSGSLLRITAAGTAALGNFDPLPTGVYLQHYLLGAESKLSGMEKALLRAIADAYPAPIGKGAARQTAGYADSGPVSRAFARLIRYGYVAPEGAQQLRASPRLFGGG